MDHWRYYLHGRLLELFGLKPQAIAAYREATRAKPDFLRPTNRVACVDGKPIELSAREVGLLEIFLQRAGRLVSKHQLVNHLCEWGEEVSANAIEVYVHRLRKKLEPGGVRIVTVRGLGYSLEKAEGE